MSTNRSRSNKFRTPVFKMPKFRSDENSRRKRVARRNLRAAKEFIRGL